MLSDGVAVYTPGVSQRRFGETFTEHPDRLGTQVQETRPSTSQTFVRVYDAFGVRIGTGGYPQGPFGYAGAQGYQEDADSGLMLLGTATTTRAPDGSSRGTRFRTGGTGTGTAGTTR